MKRSRAAGLMMLAAVTGACGSGAGVRTSPPSTTLPAPATTLPAAPIASTVPSTLATPHPPSPPTTTPARVAPVTTRTPVPTTQAGARAVSGKAVTGGLTVTVTASPSPSARGAPVQFELTATETQPQGAFGYQIAYGDGATDQNAVPQFCVAGSGSPQTQRWELTHAYAASGTFNVSVTVSANCTSDRATATLSVTIS